MGKSIEELMKEYRAVEFCEDMRRLLEALGGSEGAQKNLPLWRAGRIRLEMVPVLQDFFDETGRFAPENFRRGRTPADPDCTFTALEQKARETYGARLEALRRAFEALPFGVVPQGLHEAQKKLWHELAGNARLRNILRGPCFEVMLPQCVVGDLGTTIKDVSLPALERIVESRAHGNKIVDHSGVDFTHNLEFAPKSGCGELYQILAEQPRPILVFPEALRTLDVQGCWEATAFLNREEGGFVLADPFTTMIAICTYPDYLIKDDATPGLDCAGATLRGRDEILYFKVSHDQVLLGRRPLEARGYTTALLMYIGQGNE